MEDLTFTKISGIGYLQIQDSSGPYWTYIQGPAGIIKIWDIGRAPAEYYQEYPDRLWDLYKWVLAVLDGHYHCCLSGKCWNL